MKSIIKIAFALAILATTACANRKLEYTQNNTISTDKEGKGLNVTIQWIKFKGDKFDVQYWIQNKSEHNVTMDENSFGLKYAGVESALNRTGRQIMLKPGGVDMFHLTFRFPQEMNAGDTATITIDPIHQGDLDKKEKTLTPLKIEMAIAKQ